MKHDVAMLKSGTPSVSLKVTCDPAITGLHVSRVYAGALTTYHSHHIDHPLYETVRGIQRLSPPGENPFLPEAATATLDEHGLIYPDTVLREGCILASILLVGTGPGPSVVTLPAGWQRVRDESLECLPQWIGFTATSVQVLPPGKPRSGILSELKITLECLHPLEIGDILLVNHLAVPVASIGEEEDTGIRVDPRIGRSLGLAAGATRSFDISVGASAASYSIFARNTGYYSLITHAPLGGRLRTGGQPLAAAHVQTLRAYGLQGNLVELLTLKYADVGNRPALRAALAGEGPFPQPGAAFSLHVLRSEFTGLGFRPHFAPAGDHLSLTLALMNDADRRALSSGAVTTPETIHYRTYKPVTGGLFCETVFGPEEDQIQTLGTQSQNAVRSVDRGFRWGHIDLVAPIIPPYWRLRGLNDEPSFLATYLGVSDDQIERIVHYADFLEITEDQPSFLNVPSTDTVASSGPEAIAQLLALARRKNSTLPDMESWIIHRIVLVLPPDLRPLVLLESGNFATSDLNDLYRRVINRNNRLRKLIELKAPEAIIRNEKRMLQQDADGLFDNGSTPRPALGPNNRPLVSLTDMLLSRLREDPKVRTDYSACAHAVPNPLLPPDTVALPARIYDTLHLSELDPVLLTRPSHPGDPAAPMVFLRPSPGPHSAIGLPPVVFDHLFADLADLPVCVVHRPLLPQAAAEARAHLGQLLISPPPDAPDWLAERSPRLIENLLASALSGRSLPFSSPHGILVAGPGITELTPIPTPKKSAVPLYRDIPVSQ